MSDPRPDTPREDNPSATRIAVENDLRTWAKKFDASPEQIKEAVQAVGNHADDVEAHLKGSRATSNTERTVKNLDKPK